MAENKGMLLAKSVQKHAGRAKEKLLQNLGKVDRTGDEIFDEHLSNFNRQQNSATRLQKEFNNYIRCVRAVQTASKSLMEAISEVYEGQWTGSEALYAQTNTVEVLFQDFSHKLGDQVLIPLNTYTSQFPEMRKKIDKRGRKLVDYDSQRHSFQGLQANAAKRKDDVKVTKGREQLEEAKRTYEVLNTELHDELPALHDSRILFLVTNLQTLFASEQQFHSETAKVYAELEAIVDKLATESQRGSYTLKKITVTVNDRANSTPSSPPQSPVKANLSIVNNITNGSANANGPNSTPSSPPQSPVKANLSIVNNITNGSANANGPISTSPSISPSPEQPHNLEDTEPSYQNSEVVKSTSAALRSSTTTPTTINNIDSINNTDASSQQATAAAKTPEPPTTTTTTSATTTGEKVTTNGTDHNHHDDHHPSSQTQNNTPDAVAADSTSSSPAPPASPLPGADPLPPALPSSPSPTTTPTTAGAAVSQSSNTNVNKLNPSLGYITYTNAYHQHHYNDHLQNRHPHHHIAPSSLHSYFHHNHHNHQQQHQQLTPTTHHQPINAIDPSSLTSNSSTAELQQRSSAGAIGPAPHHIYSNVPNNIQLNNINNNVNSHCSMIGTTTSTTTSTHTNNNNSKLEELYDIPVGATTTDLPPGVLYRVKATYKYVREDVDELSFEVGDTINVIEYEDQEDQEEGWLMGIKEGTNDKGMFPANFTRPL